MFVFLLLQAHVFHWHSVRARIFMLSNVPKATVHCHLFMLPDDCVCDNIWATHRTISADNFRNGCHGLLQWHTNTFVFDQSRCYSCWNRCTAHRLQQPLQASGVYITAECILCGVHTVLFRPKLSILRSVLGHTAFGLFDIGRLHHVHNVLLSGQLLWCYAHGIATSGQVDTHWVQIVCTADGNLDEDGHLADGPICEAFGGII